MRLGGEGLLLRRRRRGNSIRTTVEAGVVIIDDRRVVYDRCVHKGRPNHGRIYVHRSRVVREDARATHHRQTRLRQSESIVHTVEADLCPPITGVEDIRTAGSPPSITRCPEISRSRSEDPRVPGTQ